jgi:flagellar protein FliJ
MKKRIQRLQPIVELSQRHEQTELQHLARIQQLIRSDEEKLQELNGYREDYHIRLKTITQEPVSMLTVQNFQGFLSQLDAAIDQQQNILNQRSTVLEEQRQRYLKATQRASALSSLQDKFHKNIELAANKQEQKDSDERNRTIRSIE